MATKVYRQIASLLQAIENCEQSPRNVEWANRHDDRLHSIAYDCLPSGSGIDCGTKIDDTSRPDRIVLTFSYHHMNENGMYDGWTEHKAIITPSLLSDFDIRITGRDRNMFKDYLYETFDYVLRLDCEIVQDDKVKLIYEKE